MIEFIRCLDCQTIHRDGKLSFEWIPGTVNLRASCPTCGCERFGEVKHVCTECERHEAVANDDLCQTCLDAEKDALEDIRLTAEEARQRRGKDLSDLCRDVLIMGARRLA